MDTPVGCHRRVLPYLTVAFLPLNTLMAPFKKLPWTNEPHPSDYDGPENVCLIRWQTHLSSTTKDTHQSVAIMNNIHIRGKMINKKDQMKNGTVTFLDLDKVPVQSALRIINGYKSEMPLFIWCDIYGIDLPPRAIIEIPFQSMRHVIGPMNYFNMKPIITKKRKAKKLKLNNVRRL